MKKVITEVKKYSIVLIIVSAVLGALLIAFPDKMIQYTALFIGGAFVACGVYAILSYIINKKYVFTLTLGIISAVAGVVVCCAYRQIITVIIFLLGLYLLVGGLFNLVDAFWILKAMPKSWFVTMLLGIASSVLGIVCLTNPFGAQSTLVRFIGIGLIVFAVTDLIAYLQVKEIANEVRDQINDANAADGSVEVEYREVDD